MKLAWVLAVTLMLAGCSKANKYEYRVTSVRIASGVHSKASDGDTYIFTATGSTIIQGWSVNPTHPGDTLCSGIARAQHADCSVIDPTWIGTVTAESLPKD